MLKHLIELIDAKMSKTETVKSLAQKIGVPYTTLYSMYIGQNKNPKIETIKKICDFYNVSIASVLSDEKESVYPLKSIDEVLDVRVREHLTSLINGDLIRRIPSSSTLFFRSHKGDRLNENNYYLCRKNETEVVLRIAVKEDRDIILISKNGIKYDIENEDVVMVLDNIRI